MNIKAILCTAVLIISSHVHAIHLFQLSKEPLIINQCPISSTDNLLDLALLNKGYFVVSHGKRVSEHLFTRFGRMSLDSKEYIRNMNGEYLLGISKKPGSNHLSKIKIPLKPSTPQITRKVDISINLPATANKEYLSSTIIYDALSGTHILTIRFEKIRELTWSSRVFIDDIEQDQGTLIFKPSGILSEQIGFEHVNWPEDGLNKLNLNFKHSTQYAEPYSINFIRADGHSMGHLAGLGISDSGDIVLYYTNGQHRILKRIAVAFFTNPEYLTHVMSHLYRPTEKSGMPGIHWANSDYSMMSNALEEQSC
ncbi:flagellar hook-basal body complex protein [uncultured Legionella sp.]|uniref:flagellar hook-basal body complex protein n=1 Tax=uncultured Legionella sp. TaxID=210934 RepID=UPI002620C805|nr:flagellar hook-basal body complex protein [uncultured Legionella sp.]